MILNEFKIVIKNNTLQSSPVWKSYWSFAAERQNVFFAKFEGKNLPFTNDPILLKYRFTNAYRASDRVSQYLIKSVIYTGSTEPEEIFFRIILFKIFNKIETWETLVEKLGDICYSSYSFDKYDSILLNEMNAGERIYSAAYIMPSGISSFNYKRKHQNHLKLIELMMQDNVAKKLQDCYSMKEAFELLKSYPTIGDFLAYQFVVDINYSTLTNFSEMDFVVAGPGAKKGIHKCFKDIGHWQTDDLIKWVTESQEIWLDRFEIDFKDLFGRRLQLIDCQNLFCEIDKYSRVAYPELNGDLGSKRIKQIYKQNNKKIDYWFPPKWNLDLQIKKKKKFTSSVGI